MRQKIVLAFIATAAALILWRVFHPLQIEDTAVEADAGPRMAVLRRGNGPEPEALNPQNTRTDAAFNIARDLFEGLTSHDPDGKIVPGVAESWQVSEDGLTYTFALRQDARWSNGDPLTAEDFVYSFRRLVDPATGAYYAASLSPVVNADAIIAGNLPPEDLGVEAAGPHSLIIYLRSPTPYILDLCTHPSLFPVHRASLETHGDAYGRPGNLVSNGAFVASEWVLGSFVSAVRNTEYWGNAANAIDKVIFYNTVDTSAELQRYRAGELDFTGSIPLPQFDWIKQNLGKELHISPYLTTYYYGLNLTRPPFASNPKLRQALAMAVDREILTEHITGTGELPAYGWVPPGTNYYTPQSFAWANLSPQARIAEAQRLYAEAGYSREQPLRAELRYNTADLHRRVAVAVAEMWKEHLGVELTLVNEEFRVMIQNIREKQVTEIFRSSWIGDYNDAFTFSQFLHSNFGLNLVGYTNPKYDALLEQAGAETDLRRRRALLEEAERLMLADTPLIPLYFHVSRHLVKPYVRGWRDNIMNIHYSRHLSLQ